MSCNLANNCRLFVIIPSSTSPLLADVAFIGDGCFLLFFLVGARVRNGFFFDLVAFCPCDPLGIPVSNNWLPISVQKIFLQHATKETSFKQFPLLHIFIFQHKQILKQLKLSIPGNNNDSNFLQ